MGPNLRPVAQIGMAAKARPTLERLQREYGGRMRTAWKGNERWSEEARWTIQSAELVAMLQRVAPFLDLKAEQARLCLKAAEIHDALPKIGRRRWTPEARERVGTIRKRIMELNRRGPQIETQVREGAIALLVAGQWVSPQTDLFSDLGFTPFSGPWPRSAMSRDGIVYELPTWARLTGETAGSASPPSHLLPTPSAEESTPTDEFLDEVREYLDPDDPHHRLWLPGRRWMAQRTLSRTIPALLPTPQAADGERGPDYARQRERVETHGSGGDDLTTTIAKIGGGEKLLPTPTAGDAKAAGSRNLEGSSAHPGVSLTDAIQTGDSTTPRRLLPTPTAEDGERGRHGSGSDRLGAGTFDEVRLLPTPQAADGDGGRQEKGAMSAGGKRPSGQKATLPLPTAVSMREDISERPFAAADPGEQASLFDGLERAEDADALLPTPVANPENPGAGGELRAAIVHGEGRRNETGVDTLGRPNRGRPGADDPLAAPDHLLPTPLVTSDRKSRKSMVENRQWAAPSLGQAVEIAAGVLPREFESWDEVPGELGRNAREQLLPTPNTRDHHAQGAGHNPKAHSTALSTMVEKTDQLLPTPTTQDAANTAGPSQHARHSDPLNVAAAKLLPTPTGTEDGRKSDRALRARGEGGMGSPPGLGQTIRESVGAEIAWGVYEGAVRRWEAVLGREAPAPTDEKGRLAPEFVEWMLGYPEGWFDLPGLKRTAKLRALGNSVQVQCGEVVGDWARALVLSGLLIEDS